MSNQKRITSEDRVHHGDTGFTRAAMGRPKLSKSDPVLLFYSYTGLAQHQLRLSSNYLLESVINDDLIFYNTLSIEARQYVEHTHSFLGWLDDVLFYLSGVIHSIYKIDFNKIRKVNALNQITRQLGRAVSDFKAIEYRAIRERNSEFVKSCSPLNLLREYIRLVETQFWVVIDKLKLTQPHHYVERVMPYIHIISAFINRCSDHLYWFMKMLNSELNNQPYAQWCSTLPKLNKTIALSGGMTKSLNNYRNTSL